MHSKDATGNKLPMLPDTEVPCLYPHHVIKHEFQVEAALYRHLDKKNVKGYEIQVSILLSNYFNACI